MPHSMDLKHPCWRQKLFNLLWRLWETVTHAPRKSRHFWHLFMARNQFESAEGIDSEVISGRCFPYEPLMQYGNVFDLSCDGWAVSIYSSLPSYTACVVVIIILRSCLANYHRGDSISPISTQVMPLSTCLKPRMVVIVYLSTIMRALSGII